MKRILLASMAAAMALSASAITFKEKYPLRSTMTKPQETPTLSNPTNKIRHTRSDEGMVRDPEGTKSRYAMAVDIFLSHLGATHVGGFGAEVYTDESDFFSRAFTLNFFQQGYSKGTIEGDNVVFPSGQYIYDTEDGEKACMYSAYMGEDDDWPVIVDTFTLTKDENGRYLSAPGYYFMVLTDEVAEIAKEEGIFEDMDIICFGTNYVFTPIPAAATDNVPPSDAKTFECQFIANSLREMGSSVTTDVTVSVSGEDIYVGGLSSYLPTACFKGTKTSANTYTFDTHQYIGYHDRGDYPYIYEFTTVNPLYFDGESLYFNETGNFTMTFDDEKTILKLEDEAGLFISAYGDINTWNEVYWNMMIGDFNQPLTPETPTDVNCYPSMSQSYIVFEWSDMSAEGIPMNHDNLWCEVIVNGKPYTFKPEYYEGLSEPTDRAYFNTSGIDGIYTGDFTTIYLNEYDGRSNDIKTIGVKIGFDGGGETRYTDIVYANGYEPFEDKAFVPSKPSDLVFYKDYYNSIRFKLTGTDTEGNPIPERLMAVEILIDGKPFVFKDDQYYFEDGNGPDVTIVGLHEQSINYSYSLVSHFGDEYILALWDDDNLERFKTLEVRPVCTGADTFTYGEGLEVELERPATPANPWDVTFDSESRELEFGALPLAKDGNGVAPWNYGYEIYVNGELFTFQAAPYELDSDITVIPYEGFEYNYNFYLHSQNVYDETDWSLIGKDILLSVDMGKDEISIDKIGVRAVYTDGEGNTTYSAIVNSDGTVGVNAIGEYDQTVKWYNLQGVEVVNPQPGNIYLRKQGVTTEKVYVK